MRGINAGIKIMALGVLVGLAGVILLLFGVLFNAGAPIITVLVLAAAVFLLVMGWFGEDKSYRSNQDKQDKHTRRGRTNIW